jgi:hypothetical protein
MTAMRDKMCFRRGCAKVRFTEFSAAQPEVFRSVSLIGLNFQLIGSRQQLAVQTSWWTITNIDGQWLATNFRLSTAKQPSISSVLRQK